MFSLPAMNIAAAGSLGSMAGATSCCDSGGKDRENRFDCDNCELEKFIGVVPPGVASDCKVGVRCTEDGLSVATDCVNCGDSCCGEVACLLVL